MRLYSLAACACLWTLIAAGCVDPAAGGPGAAGGPRRTTAQAAKLQGKLDTLKSRNFILAAHLEEQLEREKRLANELNRLRFLSRQQAEQIKVLSGAPAERDAHRQRSKELKAEVARLEQRITERESHIVKLQDTVTELKKIIAELQETIVELKESIAELLSEETPPVTTTQSAAK